MVNTGIISDVLLKKKDIYPYSHIILNNATLNGSTWTFNMSVLCMDIVDISKEQTTDIFRGQNNLQDVLNTQLAVINRFVDVLKRGENTDLYTLDGSPICEPFEDRFEHGVAGWTVTFDFIVPNTMTICDGTNPDPFCKNAEYLVQYLNGTLIESGSILSGGNVTVNVPNPSVCDDATAVLKDTNGTTISTTNIPSGDTEDIEAPDATYEVKYADNTPIDNGSIVSGGSKVVTVPNPVCDPVTLDINDTEEGTFDSGTTIDLQLIDEDTNPVTPVSVGVVGQAVTVTLPNAGVNPVGATLMKTGQTTQRVPYDDGAQEMGRLTDHVTLNKLNPFGTYDRFTDKTNAGTFANSVAYDWSTYDVETGKVLAYYFGDAGFRNLTDQCAQHVTSTIDGLANNWFLTNYIQMVNIVNGELIANFMLNYAPFNITSRYLWLSSSGSSNGTATDLAADGWLIAVGKSNTYQGIWVRECTVVGTTIT
jgi:hypothetical protein